MKISNASVSSALSGISFTPNGASKLIVTDSIIVNNRFLATGTGAGILVKPSPGGSARVMIEPTNISANVFGIAENGSNSTGGINMTITDSLLAGNINDAVVATTSSGGAPIDVTVKNTKSTNNGFGIRSIGPKVTVRVDGSTIIGNGTGVNALSGGALLSTGNNVANERDKPIVHRGSAVELIQGRVETL
jgi:hypothetical protein